MAIKLHMIQMFHKISITYEPQIIHIHTEDALFAFLKGNKQNLVELIRHIYASYEKIYQFPLKINAKSLTMEIVIHIWLDSVSKKVIRFAKKCPKIIRFFLHACFASLQNRTEWIDCGERPVDRNRWVFDCMIPLGGVFFGRWFGQHGTKCI